MIKYVHYTFEGLDARNTEFDITYLVNEKLEEISEKKNKTNYTSYAESELNYVNNISEQGKTLIQNLLLVTSDHDHSGSSIGWVNGLFRRMMNMNGWLEYDEEMYSDKEYEMSACMMNGIVEMYAAYDVYSRGMTPEEKEIALGYFAKLVMFEPITSLTFEDSEWMDVSYGHNPVKQNRRCGAIFKDAGNDAPYFLDAFIWGYDYEVTWNDSGISKSYFTGGINNSDDTRTIASRAFIDIPKYLASGDTKLKKYYIDVIETKLPEDDWEYHLVDESAFYELVKESYYIPTGKEILPLLDVLKSSETPFPKIPEPEGASLT